jgi:hypothetical protein
MDYAYCREMARNCLDKAAHSDLTEERRTSLLWMADQWLELADELESLGFGPERAFLPESASSLQ